MYIYGPVFEICSYVGDMKNECKDKTIDLIVCANEAIPFLIMYQSIHNLILNLMHPNYILLCLGWCSF